MLKKNAWLPRPTDMTPRVILLLVAVALVAGAFSVMVYPYLRRGPLSPQCFDVPCEHLRIRMPAIESHIAQNPSLPVYIAFGDSITEYAILPELCGRQPINAGIGDSSVASFIPHAQRLAQLANADFIVITLGTKDALVGRRDQFRQLMDQLLQTLSGFQTLLVPLPPGPAVKEASDFNAMLAEFGMPTASSLRHVDTTDGIHLTAPSYVEWKQTLVDAATRYVCPDQQSKAHLPAR